MSEVLAPTIEEEVGFDENQEEESVEETSDAKEELEMSAGQARDALPGDCEVTSTLTGTLVEDTQGNPDILYQGESMRGCQGMDADQFSRILNDLLERGTARVAGPRDGEGNETFSLMHYDASTKEVTTLLVTRRVERTPEDEGVDELQPAETRSGSLEGFQEQSVIPGEYGMSAGDQTPFSWWTVDLAAWVQEERNTECLPLQASVAIAQKEGNILKEQASSDIPLLQEACRTQSTDKHTAREPLSAGEVSLSPHVSLAEIETPPPPKDNTFVGNREVFPTEEFFPQQESPGLERPPEAATDVSQMRYESSHDAPLDKQQHFPDVDLVTSLRFLPKQEPWPLSQPGSSPPLQRVFEKEEATLSAISEGEVPIRPQEIVLPKEVQAVAAPEPRSEMSALPEAPAERILSAGAHEFPWERIQEFSGKSFHGEAENLVRVETSGSTFLSTKGRVEEVPRTAEPERVFQESPTHVLETRSEPSAELVFSVPLDQESRSHERNHPREEATKNEEEIPKEPSGTRVPRNVEHSSGIHGQNPVTTNTLPNTVPLSRISPSATQTVHG